MRLARSGHTISDIAKSMELDVMQVGVHERHLQEYGFDTPDLIRYDELMKSSRKRIVEAHKARAEDILTKKIAGRTTNLIDDTEKRKKRGEQ